MKKRYALWLVLLAGLLAVMPVSGQNTGNPLFTYPAFISGTNQIVINDRHSLQIFDLNFQHQDTIPIILTSDSDDYIFHLSWSRTGQYFTVGINDAALSPNQLQIRDRENNEVLAEFTGLAFDNLIAWSFNDAYLAIGSKGYEEVIIVSLQTGSVVNRIKLPKDYGIYGLAWSPVANQIALVTGENDGYHLRFCDPEVDFSQCHPSEIIQISELSSLSYSPAGNQIAIANTSNSIEIRESDSGQIVQILEGHTEAIWQFTWGTGGIISAGLDETLRIWNPDTGEQIWMLDETSVEYVTWSTDSTNLFITDSRQGIHIRDAATGAILAQLCDACQESP